MIFIDRFLAKSRKLKTNNKILYSASLMIMFWAVFDGILSYMLPILITDFGYSKTQMGLIIASSNIFGAIFDFLLAKYITNTSYRRLFLIVIGLSFIYPLLLWSSKTIPFLMISMSIWGLYGDLHNFATFDFVSRRSRPKERCQNFSIIGIFKCLGYLLGPIIAGLVLMETITFLPFSLALSFVILSFIFYLVLVDLSPKKDSKNYTHKAKYLKFNFFKEFKLLKKIGIILFPVLIFYVLLHMFDAAFWTIGPLFAKSFEGFKGFGGFFMAMYILPTLLVSWYVQKITNKYGKKKTAYFSFLISSVLIILVGIFKNPVLILVVVFTSSVVGSIAWPAIRGAYVDYISESKEYEKEIESLNDFAANLGYIIGPITAGLMADRIGIGNVFVFLGIFNIVVVLLLFTITPKNIRVIIRKL